MDEIFGLVEKEWKDMNGREYESRPICESGVCKRGKEKSTSTLTLTRTNIPTTQFYNLFVLHRMRAIRLEWPHRK